MSEQQSSADDLSEELTTAIEENPEAFATFVRNLDTVNELVEVAELGTAAMDDEMVTSLAGTGASLGELADTAAGDDTRGALQTVLGALGDANSRRYRLSSAHSATRTPAGQSICTMSGMGFEAASFLPASDTCSPLSGRSVVRSRTSEIVFFVIARCLATCLRIG